MTDLKGKVAVVTGASKGIGLGIARRLAKDGAHVVLNYARSAEEAEAAVSAIVAEGGSAVAVQADVTQGADIMRLFAEADGAFGALDILVNNAGIAALSPIADADEEIWDRLFALNAKAPLFVTKEALKRMIDGGRIINISSSSTMFPFPGSAIYASSKAVIKTYTEVLAKELGGRGITVNSVVPGPTIPGMFGQAPQGMQDAAAGSSPFNRLGTPDDIASVVSFLAGDDARWVSGQHILANGAGTM